MRPGRKVLHPADAAFGPVGPRHLGQASRRERFHQLRHGRRVDDELHGLLSFRDHWVHPRALRVGPSVRVRVDPAVALVSQVLKDVERLVAQGVRVALVFDIDNTLVDTRYRTLAAAHAFRTVDGEAPFASATIADIGFNALDTCERLGILDQTELVRAFDVFWDGFFWDGDSFGYDQPVPITIALARKASELGAEIFYLTGRVEELRRASENQLRSHGLPLPDEDDAAPRDKHLLMKPAVTDAAGVRIKTPPFKEEEILRLKAEGVEVLLFSSDGKEEIAHVETRVPGTRWLLVEFPVDDRRSPAKPQAPVLSLSARIPGVFPSKKQRELRRFGSRF